jgi:NitT/TauT family transport system substrate-binding protein
MNRWILVIAAPLLVVLAGCGGGAEEAESESGLFRIVLQTDWYAQPEHGGFYQALANGYYAEEGLEVEILPGGPNALTSQKVAQGVAQFGIGRSDDVIISVGRQLPLVMVGALMQKDPQAIMFHNSSGITSVADLDGKAIMATPGSAFIRIMEQQYDIDVAVIPLDYGMNRFLADQEFIQQCFITNEPFYVARAGADVGTILLSESGFNPYRVWFTSRSFARRHPDKVAAFHRASIRGWQSYIYGEDRAAANAIIAERNPKMDAEFMAFSLETMRAKGLISGDSGELEAVGRIERERVAEQIEQLISIEMIEPGLDVDSVYLDPASLEGEAEEPTPQAASGVSLPVLDFNGRRLTSIEPELLASMNWLRREAPIENVGKLAQVRGVPLLDVLAELSLPGNWDFVLANCSDGYQSNYTRDVLRNNFPFLILEIDGKPTAEWAAAKGHPEWGPFMIHTFVTDGLLDPVNKNPWGVESLKVGRLSDLTGKLFAGQTNVGADHPGFSIFKSNCASCHRFPDTQFGGVLSTRDNAMLAMLARHSEAYFRAMLKDPAGTNILAAKMPAVDHYGSEEIDALVAFMAALVE